MEAIAIRLNRSVRAALIHLAISAAVALLANALVFICWYPGLLANGQGVSHLVLIMIGVDVVIGPLITLFVFVPGKKHLRLDLMVIAALQTAALLYGLQAIQGGRPAFVVFNVDRFDVVAVKDVPVELRDRAAPGFDLSWWGPIWAAARLPADPEKRSDILFSAMGGGPDLPQMPEFFVPLEDERDQMLTRLRPLDELRRLNEVDAGEWRELVGEFGKPESELGYLPLRANAKDGAVILDAKSAAILGIRLLTPNFATPSKPETPPSSTPAPAPDPAPSKSRTAPAASQGVG